MPITNREATFFPYRVPPIAVYILLFLFSVLIFALYGLDLPLHRDNGIYVYSGQRLLLGEIPYQSVFDGKTPMTPFVTAFALYISQPFFDDPLRGMRVVYMIIGIITILLSYPLAQKLFKDKFAAILAPLMMIGLHGYMFQAAIGARPKQLLLIFFVTGLIFLLDKRWLLLGFFAALCAFTWQPSGVLFLGSLLYALLQRKEERLRALSMLILGAAVPTVVIGGYFFLNGAFKEFIQGAFIVHSYLSRADEHELYNIFKMIFLGYPFSSGLILLGLAAFFIYGFIRTIWSGGTRLTDNPYVPLIVIYSLIWIASLLNFQGYSDFYIFLPFTVLGFIILYRAVIEFITDKRLLTGDTALKTFNSVVLLIMCAIPFLNLGFSDIISDHTAIWRGALGEQKKAYSDVMKAALGSYDENTTTVAIAIPELPALLGLRNVNPYVLNDIPGYDAFIASNYSNGFAGWLDEMSARNPDIVIIKTSELGKYSQSAREMLIDWANSRFSYVSANEAIHSEKFRSTDVHTWVRAR